jgi:thimet oligopeptidase
MNYINKRVKAPVLRVTTIFLVIAVSMLATSYSYVDPTNPFIYRFNKTIDFAAVKVEDIKSITQHSIDESKVELEKIFAIPANQRTFQNTMVALDDVYNKLGSMNTPVSFLKNVTTSREIGAAANAAIQQISQYYNELSQNENIYKAAKEYTATKEAQSLTGYKKKALTESLRDFRRNGFELSADKRGELKSLKDKLSSLSLAFTNNIAEYQDSLILSEKEMEGLPESYKNAARRPDGTYKIDMSNPSYIPYMENATSTETRKKLFKKHNSRAAKANLPVLKELIETRTKLAQLLGYKTFAEYQTETRMVRNPMTVWEFENKLLTKVKAKAQLDYNELLDAKRAHLKDHSIKNVDPWENAFYRNILLKTKYNLDPEKLKEYFELNNVLNGILKISEHLYSVKFKEVSTPSTWHEEVRLFEVLDNGKTIGKFYLDLHPRKDKYNHAACFPITKGKLTSQGYQIPVAALVCNFTAPTKEQPALMSQREVTTFFHEFGHVLHNMFTKSELSGYSGTSVARDFVEAPSQIYENWVYDYNVLKMFAKHYQTGKVIPKDLYDRMIAAKNVGSGLGALTQIFYGIYDMTLHDKYDPTGKETTTDILKKVQKEVMLYPYMEETHFQAAFGHLTGYAAGYYGYLWAEVYAQDMFSVFEKNGILDKKTGKRYRDIILASGGDEEPLELVKKFLGREPNENAFLKSLGLK